MKNIIKKWLYAVAVVGCWVNAHTLFAQESQADRDHLVAQAFIAQHMTQVSIRTTRRLFPGDNARQQETQQQLAYLTYAKMFDQPLATVQADPEFPAKWSRLMSQDFITGLRQNPAVIFRLLRDVYAPRLLDDNPTALREFQKRLAVVTREMQQAGVIASDTRKAQAKTARAPDNNKVTVAQLIDKQADKTPATVSSQQTKPRRTEKPHKPGTTRPREKAKTAQADVDSLDTEEQRLRKSIREVIENMHESESRQRALADIVLYAALVQAIPEGVDLNTKQSWYAKVFNLPLKAVKRDPEFSAKWEQQHSLDILKLLEENPAVVEVLQRERIAAMHQSNPDMAHLLDKQLAKPLAIASGQDSPYVSFAENDLIPILAQWQWAFGVMVLLSIPVAGFLGRRNAAICAQSVGKTIIQYVAATVVLFAIGTLSYGFFSNYMGALPDAEDIRRGVAMLIVIALAVILGIMLPGAALFIKASLVILLAIALISLPFLVSPSESSALIVGILFFLLVSGLVVLTVQDFDFTKDETSRQEEGKKFLA